MHTHKDNRVLSQVNNKNCTKFYFRMEPKGMTPDIVEKLNEKAKVLTGDRRKRSKMVPEELMSADSIRGTCLHEFG